MNEPFDWYQIKYLESIGNLTDLIRERSHINITAPVATDITVNLQQGRAFFEQSESAAMEIKPLLVFYGMLAFARAVILSRRNVTLNTLAPRHGLSDPPTTNTLLENLEVKVQPQGTFPELVDSTRTLEKLIVHSHDAVGAFVTTKLPHPPGESIVLSGKSFTLKSILARISDLGKLYKETFSDEQKVVTCSSFFVSTDSGDTCLEVYDGRKVQDIGSLKDMVTSLRSRFHFLKQWSVVSATKDGTVEFSTHPRDEATEFSEGGLRDDTRKFVRVLDDPSTKDCVQDPRSRVSPVYGNLRNYNTVLIEPIAGVHVSELSLYYAGMYLLSSLVRYRPTIWANSISRRSLGSSQPDDKPLALIELFLQLAINRFPRMTVNAIRESD